MPLISTSQDTPLTAPVTRPTAQVAIEALDNVFVVHGAFGTSGLYPLDHAERLPDGRAILHCSLYFIRLAPGEVARERNPVVIEKTEFALRYRGQTHHNEELCTVCENRQCPANRHEAAISAELLPGKLVLSLA